MYDSIMNIIMQKTYIVNRYDNGKPRKNDDFYGCTNYEWIRNNTIPEDEVKYTHFIQTQLAINNDLKAIIENNSFPLATQMYNSYTNMTYRNRHCLNQVKEIIELINQTSSFDDLIKISAKLAYIGISTFFNVSVDANVFTSTQNIFYIAQPTLGLPDREYYHNPKHQRIRQKYYETICLTYKELYPQMSTEQINSTASFLIDIEAKLSIIFLSNADRRDADSTYHEISFSELSTKYPKLKLNLFIETLCTLSEGIVRTSHFQNMLMEHHKNNSTNYFKQLEILLDSYNLEQLKDYFTFHTILAYMNLTNDRMGDIHFEMFKKTIRGQTKPKLLSRSALSFSCSMFNDPISRIYRERFFSIEAKNYMIDMVENIKLATKERINNLEWMSQKTKVKAIRKLKKMKLKLGYSKSEPRTYDDIQLTSCIVKNTIIMNTFNMTYTLNKLNKSVDLEDWELPSYIVNAYFNPTRNEILFPAAILQPPFLDLTKDDIYNYGHIGTVIGHEIIHGFDDQGSKFDENGSISDWWETDDKIKYDEKVKKIIQIYNLEGINGKLTAGENIADFGAVVMPLFGLKYRLKRGLTNDEIKKFYKSYALHWQYLIRPEAAEERRLSDPHAFSDLRVNVPLKNSVIFQEIFDIQPTDRMYIEPDEILTIW